MRQRKIKDIDNKLAAYGAFTVPIPAANKGKWQEIFGNHNPIYLEIGCGKGQFITEMAKKYPDRNFVAIEGHQSVVLRAFEKADADQIANVRFVLEYVKDIREFFADGELAGVYLNFSDPCRRIAMQRGGLPTEKGCSSIGRLFVPVAAFVSKQTTKGCLHLPWNRLKRKIWKF